MYLSDRLHQTKWAPTRETVRAVDPEVTVFAALALQPHIPTSVSPLPHLD